jgi:hypothetical protein
MINDCSTEVFDNSLQNPQKVLNFYRKSTKAKILQMNQELERPKLSNELRAFKRLEIIKYNKQINCYIDAIEVLQLAMNERTIAAEKPAEYGLLIS